MKFANRTTCSRPAGGLLLAAIGCVALVAGACGRADAAGATNGGPDPLVELRDATFKLTHAESSGTCFLVSAPGNSGRHAGTVVLITAAHALEQAPGQDCVIVLRDRTGENSCVRREVPLRIRANGKALWTKHPTEDVAAIRMTLPRGLHCDPLRFEQLARPEDFRNGRIRLGSETWAFCYPAQLEANEAGFPVLRRGSIASMPLAPLETHGTFLVDSTTFGGDSGAPVLVTDRAISKPTALVAGVVLGMQRQTDKSTMPFEERTVHHPLGLAIVAHAEVIRQTIERALK